MKVDFSNLEQSVTLLFNNNKQEVLEDYVKMTDVLQKRSSDLSWLLNNVTSRNTYFSKLFYYMRCERLLYDLSKSSNIEEVITNDIVLDKLLSAKYRVVCTNKDKDKSLLYSLKVFFRCLKWSLCGFVCKSPKRILRLRQSKGATIIDTDIAKKTDKYNDRYYGNVLDTLPSIITSDFFYIIIYVPYPKKKDLLLIDKNTPYNTIYLWDFLKPQDYVLAFYRMHTKKYKSLLDYEYLGINQRPALESVYKESNGFYYYVSELYERVIYRMSKMHINVRLFIDWFENQAVDKSFHWAMAQYFPETKVHSYIGLMADTTENPITIATNTELNLNIAPKYLFTCNEALKDQYFRSGYGGCVNIAPFYRATSIWNVSKSSEVNEFFTILVPLGLNKTEVEFKINFFVSLLHSNSINNIRVLIKPHPVYNESSIRQKIEDIKAINIVCGDIYDYLTKADAVVASNSTTTYESLALGVPLLYLIDPEYRFSLNRPKKVLDFMWYAIKDLESFKEAIMEIKVFNKKKLKEEGIKLKEYYFTNNTSDLTRSFFGL